MTTALELGQTMVQMVNSGREGEAAFVDEYYAETIVSLEGGGDDGGIPARMEGVAAIKGKHQWWYDNNDVHGTEASGPYLGHREDQFIIRFVLDMTPNGGERTQLDEVGLYTVVDGKIVQEEYLYLTS